MGPFARTHEKPALAAPVAAGEEIGRWRVEETVWEEAGGSSVFEVSDGPLRARLELVPQGAGQPRDLRRRFKRLLKARTGLEHPNVLPVLDGGESDQGVYVVAAPCDAPTLADELEPGPLEPERAVSLLSQVADALDQAAARGVLHHELTPGAIQVVDGEHPLLGNFGIARPASGSGLVERVEFPHYLSPEEIRSEPATVESSVYSLACILYECLTGGPPFPADWYQAVAYAHLTEEAPPPSEQLTKLPRELDAVLARGLAKDPDERYGTPGELMHSAAAALGRERLHGFLPAEVLHELELEPAEGATNGSPAPVVEEPEAEAEAEPEPELEIVPDPAPPAETVLGPTGETQEKVADTGLFFDEVEAEEEQGEEEPPAPAEVVYPPPAAAEAKPSHHHARRVLALGAAVLVAGIAGGLVGANGSDDKPQSRAPVAAPTPAAPAPSDADRWLARATPAVARLGRERTRARSRLARASTKQGQARAARSAAAAYRAAARALAGPPGAKERALRSAALSAAAAYSRLAARGAHGQPVGWNRARRDVRGAERRFSRAAAAL